MRVNPVVLFSFCFSCFAEQQKRKSESSDLSVLSTVSVCENLIYFVAGSK